jgi:hypothetical protein
MAACSPIGQKLFISWAQSSCRRWGSIDTVTNPSMLCRLPAILMFTQVGGFWSIAFHSHIQSGSRVPALTMTARSKHHAKKNWRSTSRNDQNMWIRDPLFSQLVLMTTGAISRLLWIRKVGIEHCLPLLVELPKAGRNLPATCTAASEFAGNLCEL